MAFGDPDYEKKKQESGQGQRDELDGPLVSTGYGNDPEGEFGTGKKQAATDFTGKPGGGSNLSHNNKDKKDTKVKTTKYHQIKRVNLKKNELEPFRSHNHIWSLYCLDNNELRDPDNTYMLQGKEPNVVVIKGAGGTQLVGKRKATTSLERDGSRVEYYINSVTIDSIISPSSKTRTSQMHRGVFTVQEPYSMGQFLESLQVASQMAGHQNYVTAPFLLVCEMVGWTDDNKSMRVARRCFPIMLTESSIGVDASGSTYEVSFISQNASAYSDSVQKIPHDITIIGNKLHEVLQSGAQSLTTVLNTTLLKREDKNERVFADEYIILFPKEDALQSKKLETQKEFTVDNVTYTAQEYYATFGGEQKGTVNVDYDSWLEDTLGISVKRSDLSEAVKVQALSEENLNGIGNAKVVLDKLQEGNIHISGYGRVWDPIKKVYEQQGNNIPGNKRAFKFEKGTRINNIIEEMILTSDYGKNLLERKLEDGFRPWFTIQPMVFNVPVKEVEARKGRQPRIYVYRVIPYRVHASTWMSPTDVAPDTTPLLVDVNKEYNYMYTGKNKDVLNFELKFNYRFLTPTPLDNATDTQSKQNKGGAASTPSLGGSTPPKEGDTDKPLVPLKPLVGTDVEVITSGMRAVPQDSKDVIARTFHKALVYSNADMVQCDLEIMGDPYFLSDSGMGNYQSAQGSTWFEDENGQIDHVRSGQYIVINFRTPFDYKTGESLQEFPTMKDEKDGVVVREFSGLYQVYEIQHIFESNQFRQILKLNRMLNQQELDTPKKPASNEPPLEEYPDPEE